jgi:hypothetical protein
LPRTTAWYGFKVKPSFVASTAAIVLAGTRGSMRVLSEQPTTSGERATSTSARQAHEERTSGRGVDIVNID